MDGVVSLVDGIRRGCISVASHATQCGSRGKVTNERSVVECIANERSVVECIARVHTLSLPLAFEADETP